MSVGATKVCPRPDCVHQGVPQPTTNFYRRSRGGFGSYCKDCDKARLHAHAKAHPDKARARHRAFMARKRSTPEGREANRRYQREWLRDRMKDPKFREAVIKQRRAYWARPEVRARNVQYQRLRGYKTDPAKLTRAMWKAVRAGDWAQYDELRAMWFKYHANIQGGADKPTSAIGTTVEERVGANSRPLTQQERIAA